MTKQQTNSPDWSALTPVLPGEGPRGRAVYAELRRMIETRAFAPGQKLPPTRELAARLSVSRGAVVAAYEQLAAEGFEQARQGAGTFVASQVPEAAAAAPAPRAAPPIRAERPLPGRLGGGAADDQTLRALRKLFRQALSRPPASFLHYGDAQGDAGLRAEIAAYLRAARGMRVAPEQLVITAGTQAGLDLAVRAALAPGDAIWMEDPGYPNALNCFRGAGLDPVPVPVDDEGLDPQAGARLAPQARAVYLTPSHQFPLGVTLTMARRMALLDWAEAAGAWVIEDDYDSEFRYTGPPLAALQGMDRAGDRGGRVIYLGTFSKALAPGLRLGFMVLPERLIAPVAALRDRIDRYPNALTETVLHAFLAEGHYAAHLRRARKTARAARDALVEGFSDGPFLARAPEQGLHLIVWPQGMDEDQAMAHAARAGMGPRALSRLYQGSGGRQGLVMGFSGFPPEALGAAARRLSRGAAGAG